MTDGVAAPITPPTRAESTGEIRIEASVFGDRVYRWATTGFALVIPTLLLLIAFEVFVAGWPALSKFGLSFLTSSDWDAVNGKFGAAPAIYGTLVSSTIHF